MTIKYHNSWKDFFETNKQLVDDILSNIDFTQTVYPNKDEIFKVFDYNLNDIKVVILGQDPYYNEGQANGLAFAVNKGQKIPPSLKNIFETIEYQTNSKVIADSTLLHWSEQGVFLLNTALTVVEKKPNIHRNIWKPFTDNVIKYIDSNVNGVSFLLWGNNAKKVEKLITNNEVLSSVHPSPLSFYHGFKDNNHFINKGIKW